MHHPPQLETFLSWYHHFVLMREIANTNTVQFYIHITFQLVILIVLWFRGIFRVCVSLFGSLLVPDTKCILVFFISCSTDTIYQITRSNTPLPPFRCVLSKLQTTQIKLEPKNYVFLVKSLGSQFTPQLFSTVYIPNKVRYTSTPNSHKFKPFPEKIRGQQPKRS